ncbi:MAG: hypothetical protein HQ554_05580, partial [FCB group bacterium]|nr:hypothetical protein [FCB group bacterium]
KLGEPVIIYHHPHHKLLDIFDKLFDYINSKDFGNMNMLEFSKWWEKRYKIEPEFQYVDNRLSLKYESENVFVRISTEDGFIISHKREIKLDKINLKPHPKPIIKSDLNRIRKFHWRDLLHDHESKKSRKYYLKN